MMRFAFILLFATTLGACQTARPPVVVAQAPEPEPDDAFSTFTGPKAALGEVVNLHREPVGISEARALVVLGRTEWVIHTLPSGTEEKTGTASLVVQRGGNAKNVRIQAGESGTALGVTIEVQEAGEVYEESSMRWVQFAKVKFSVAQ